MIYLIRPSKLLVFICLVLQLNLYFSAFSKMNDSVILEYIFLFIIFITAIILFINFEFDICDAKLVCTIKFLGFSIYKKEMFKRNIVNIKFSKSKNWTYIKLEKGFNVKINNYKYKKMHADLIVFAEKNDICIDEK